MADKKNMTLEEISAGYRKLFNSTKGKFVGYDIIAAKCNQLARDVYYSIYKEEVKNNSAEGGLVARARTRKTRDNISDNTLSL